MTNEPTTDHSYLADLDRIRKVSGSLTEGVISEAFKDLLKSWAKSDNLIFINQYPMQSSLKKRIRPDGAILYDVHVPLGYWEAKDTDDDLDAEIEAKLRTGYPQDNIIFEDSRVAVLWQDRNEITRCDMTDIAGLEQLLSLFFSYERPEIAKFRQAVEQFKTDLPAVLIALREKIDEAYKTNATFKTAAKKFLAHACETINPTLGRDDVREMLIQRDAKLVSWDFIQRLAQKKIQGFRANIGDAGNYLDRIYESSAEQAANIVTDYRDRFVIELIQNAYDAHPTDKPKCRVQNRQPLLITPFSLISAQC
ncbi:hypothetical protein ROLI_024030 [Roseobacter fucihabitans]|uniref:Uncharacterized protein n=1 Tax=Roseobacter fucihabitans TaxID=1537242 RepID=A0ABZ2BTF9_9RHOB|nr:hypothetical protein [Roseobacter litoralis]MBC6965813.1 hypothetical protein [Roseobacter litoralis]